MNNAGVVSEGCDTSANCFRMIKETIYSRTTRSGVVGMIAESDKQACEEHCQSKMHKIFEAVATTGGVGSSLSPKALTGIDGNLQKLEKALIVEFHYNCLFVETADSAALAANIQQSLHKTGRTRQLIKKEQEKAAARQSLDASQQPAAMI